MKNLVSALTGGAVIVVVATLIGVAHNAVRSNPVKLINTVKTVKQPAPAGTPATTDSDAPVATPAEGAMTADDVLALVEEGITVILDARSVEEYEEGHIPGAINLPYDLLTEYLGVLGEVVTPDQPVLCYCRGPECDLSHSLATELGLMGFEQVTVFTEGWLAWEAAGHPVVTGSEPE